MGVIAPVAAFSARKNSAARAGRDIPSIPEKCAAVSLRKVLMTAGILMENS
jgi:hypothetical protein